MKIALVHFRVYETDGVSLEMDKWKLALERIGHEVIYLSGSSPKKGDLYLEYLDYRSEYNNTIHENAFHGLTDFSNKSEFLLYIEEYKYKIYTSLKKLIKENNIDMIVPNNVSSLGFNIPVGMAIAELDINNDVQIVYHHHDFHWERERYSHPIFSEVQEYLVEYFPYKGNAKHCVINNLARKQLKKRKNIDAYVIPNVFDFDRPPWIVDEYNKDLRSRVGIKEGDIVFLQATRIVERKAIELGYHVIEEINKMIPLYEGEKLYNGNVVNGETKIHLVLAGQNELTDKKFKILNDLLQSGRVDIHYINDIVDHSREMNDGQKIYSLWDVYTMCDFITYTSILEGWGNQLLEGMFAMKPMLVYEYPVFRSDIKKTGFSLVTIGNTLRRDRATKLYNIAEDTTKRVATEIINTLFDGDKYFDVVGGNFEKAKANYSYENLYFLLRGIFRKHLQ